MNVIKELRELKDTIANEIAEANGKIRQSGGDMNTADVDIIDKLAHTMKSLATTIAMLEATEGDEGYSGRYMPYYYGDHTGTERRTGYSGNYGRYSRNESRYSRDGGNMMDHLRNMMDEAPDEMTRMEIKKLMDKIDQL